MTAALRTSHMVVTRSRPGPLWPKNRKNGSSRKNATSINFYSPARYPFAAHGTADTRQA